jgi:hypothetical protein
VDARSEQELSGRAREHAEQQDSQDEHGPHATPRDRRGISNSDSIYQNASAGRTWMTLMSRRRL